MPRTGYSTTRTPYGVGDTTNGEGTFVHNFFSTNLTTWTVGALQSFGSGNTENNYFVCTNGTHEVLVCSPNGYQQSYSDYLSPAKADFSLNANVADGALGFGYANGGGYAASFVGGLNPAVDDAFFPDDSTTIKTLRGYERSQSQDLTLYLIENTDYPELIVYCSAPNFNPSMWAFSESAFDLSRTPLGASPPFTWQTQGVYAFDPSTSTVNGGVPVTDNYFFATFAPERTTPLEDTFSPLSNALASITSAQGWPIDGQYMARRLARRIALPDEVPEYGTYLNFDRSFVRGFGDYDFVDTFGRRFQGGDADEVFVHAQREILTPWASGLPDPVIP